VITVTFAVVAFSVFAQGLTMKPLLRKLGQLSSKDVKDGATPSTVPPRDVRW
jgi:NhaP-type Na+/H+ or K+/H+ antiporter